MTIQEYFGAKRIDWRNLLETEIKTLEDSKAQGELVRADCDLLLQYGMDASNWQRCACGQTCDIRLSSQFEGKNGMQYSGVPHDFTLIDLGHKFACSLSSRFESTDPIASFKRSLSLLDQIEERVKFLVDKL